MKTIKRVNIDALRTQLEREGKKEGVIKGNSFTKWAIFEVKRLRMEGIKIELEKE